MPPPTSAWMRISELSRRVEVHAETLRAWERRYGLLRPRRTAGNTRLYSTLDETRVLLMKRYIAQQVPVAQAAEMAMSARLRFAAGATAGVPEHERCRAMEELRVALDGYDETSAERALQQLLAAYTAIAVLRDVVLPYLHEVGERWAADHLSIAQEHFTSQFFQTRLHALARGWDRGLGPAAVLAAAPGDHHTLGLMCFGIALHELGWRIISLGAATPVSLLHEVASATGAQLVVISCGVAGQLHGHRDELARLAATVTVALGGHGASSELAARCGALHLQDAIGGASEVALMRGSDGPPMPTARP